MMNCVAVFTLEVSTMANEVFIRASVPDDLRQQWLQHLRDFDTAHPGCHFEIMADCPDMPMTQVIESLRVNPGFKFSDFFPRSKP